MKIKLLLQDEHEGNVAFEFVIIMAIFAVLIFAVASSPLMGVIHTKVREITDYITNNNNAANDIWAGVI